MLNWLLRRFQVAAIRDASQLAVTSSITHLPCEPSKDSDWEDRCVNRNLEGQRLEKEGKTELAVKAYEANVVECFDGSMPYERLRIIYARERRWSDAIRVCQAFIDNENIRNIPEKEKMRAWVTKYETHLP